MHCFILSKEDRQDIDLPQQIQMVFAVVARDFFETYTWAVRFAAVLLFISKCAGALRFQLKMFWGKQKHTNLLSVLCDVDIEQIRVY